MQEASSPPGCFLPPPFLPLQEPSFPKESFLLLPIHGKLPSEGARQEASFSPRKLPASQVSRAQEVSFSPHHTECSVPPSPCFLPSGSNKKFPSFSSHTEYSVPQGPEQEASFLTGISSSVLAFSTPGPQDVSFHSFPETSSGLKRITTGSFLPIRSFQPPSLPSYYSSLPLFLLTTLLRVIRAMECMGSTTMDWTRLRMDTGCWNTCPDGTFAEHHGLGLPDMENPTCGKNY